MYSSTAVVTAVLLLFAVRVHMTFTINLILIARRGEIGLKIISISASASPKGIHYSQYEKCQVWCPTEPPPLLLLRAHTALLSVLVRTLLPTRVPGVTLNCRYTSGLHLSVEEKLAIHAHVFYLILLAGNLATHLSRRHLRAEAASTGGRDEAIGEGQQRSRQGQNRSG